MWLSKLAEQVYSLQIKLQSTKVLNNASPKLPLLLPPCSGHYSDYGVDTNSGVIRNTLTRGIAAET